MKSTHCLFYHDDVGQPFRIVDFFDEVGSKQLVHLVHDCFVSFWSENSSSLLDRLLLRIHI